LRSNVSTTKEVFRHFFKANQVGLAFKNCSNTNNTYAPSIYWRKSSMDGGNVAATLNNNQLESISPIFYEQFFGTIVFWAAFPNLQFLFVIFFSTNEHWQKAAHKMLVEFRHFTTVVKAVKNTFILKSFKIQYKMLKNCDNCQYNQHLKVAFWAKVFCTAILYLQFGFVIFCERISALKLRIKCW